MVATTECLTAAGTVTINKKKISQNEPNEVSLTSKVFFCTNPALTDVLIQRKDQLPETVKHVCFWDSASLTV